MILQAGKIIAILKKIDTNVDNLRTAIGNINILAKLYNPNWETDPQGLYVRPNSIRTSADLNAIHPVPPRKYYNYKKWFENAATLIAEIRKHNLRFKDALDTGVEFWRILEEHSEVIEDQVTPWVVLGKEVWMDPKFNAMYRR